MSRIANYPVALPGGVEVRIDGSDVTVKGARGSLSLALKDGISASQGDGAVTFAYESEDVKAMAGTTRALLANMVKGVSEGWEKKLVLNGVGYRAKASGQSVNLTVGLSHPVDYELPDGVSAETPTQTEIVVRGIDKQVVGQVAAKIRGVRPPEPYKGKGIRYADELVRRKEAKKK